MYLGILVGIRVGISVSADIQYRPIFTHIGKTNISVSVLILVPIYRPICDISELSHIGRYQ